MSSDLLTSFDYRTYKTEPIAGTEDWIEVALLGEGGYEWTTFNAFYSPSARRYFWHGDSGCSCNGWSDDLSTPADFESGDRDALKRAWSSFAKDHEYIITATDLIDGITEIRNFKEPS